MYIIKISIAIKRIIAKSIIILLYFFISIAKSFLLPDENQINNINLQTINECMVIIPFPDAAKINLLEGKTNLKIFFRLIFDFSKFVIISPEYSKIWVLMKHPL